VVSACVDLGLMLGDTLDVDTSFARDPARAESLLRGACTHGSKIACEAHTTVCTGAKPPPGC
jgi:hypothetical protein